MSKGKSITLLSIISVIVAFVLVMTFIRFPIGIKNYNSLLGAVELDYDLAGGTAYTLTLSDDNQKEVGDNIDSVIDTLEYRLKELGYSAFSVKALKSMDEGSVDYDIRIETKTTQSLASDISVVAAYGELEFFGGAEKDSLTEILTDVKVVQSAKYKGEVTTGSYGIDIEFTKEGYDALVKAIGDNESYNLKITLGEKADGTENVLFDNDVAKLSEWFTKRVMHLYSPEETGARQMALQMNSGGLAYKYDVDNGVNVSSPYGEDIATKCAVAIITVAVVLMALMVIVYKGFGITVALASLLSILAQGWLLIGVPNIVLNMGGVVGVIMATVVNALAMVILAERVREEFVTTQKTAKAAVNKGFKSALVPVINLCVVSIVFALALFAFTSGVIKGFAITFGIGCAVALISSLVFTRMYNALITPLVKDKEKFLGFKRQANVSVEEVE
ncbi:MAG: hypothetical protein E7347_03990 [Clostridiales bacterium]|nr:hypothetical protein [Clostridiales bacterium]